MKRKSIELVALSAAIAAAPIMANKQVINTKKTTKVKSEIHDTSVNNTNISSNNESISNEKTVDAGKFINLSQETNIYAEKIELLNKAIKIDPLNVAAWYAKIEVMKSNSNNTIEDYKTLTNQMINTFSNSPLELFALVIQVKDEILTYGSQADYNSFVKEIKNTLENVKNPNEIHAAKYIISLMPMYGLVESDASSISNNKESNTKNDKDKTSISIMNTKNHINNTNDTDIEKNSGEVIIKIIDHTTGKPWANKIVHVYEQYINTQIEENNNSFVVMPIDEKTYETNSSGEIAIYNLSPGTVTFTIDYGKGQQMKKTVVVQAGKVNNQEVSSNNTNINNSNVNSSNVSNNITNTNVNSNNTINNTNVNSNNTGQAVASEKNLGNSSSMQTKQYNQASSINNDKESSYNNKNTEISSNNNSNNNSNSNNSSSNISMLPDTGINGVVKGFMIEILFWISILGTLGFALNVAKNKKYINKTKKLK